MTTATLAGLVLIGGFVLLLLLRVPISFAMLLSTLGSAMVTGTNFSVLVRQMVDGANNFSLLSIPFLSLIHILRWRRWLSFGGIAPWRQSSSAALRAIWRAGFCSAQSLSCWRHC